MLQVDSNLDGLESGLEDTESCVVRSKWREMQTGSTEARVDLFEALIVVGSAGQGDPVGTPTKFDAVSPKCEAGRSSTPWRQHL